jgi:predicted nucleic acid-binding protein
VIVVDASIMIGWLLREPQLMFAPGIRKELPREDIFVPAHWPVEIANALWVNVRRGRIPLDAFDEIMDELSMFDVSADAPVSLGEIAVLTRFAISQNLTVYDAAYVQLAARLAAPLATVDREMRAAARALEVTVVPA